MTNHVHLLLAPSDYKGLGQLMKRMAGRQTRYRNRLERRSGTLWESRYKSSLVDADEYLLGCVRYIELNPVRAGMVAETGAYPRSSYQARTGIADQPWLEDVPGMETITAETQQRNTTGETQQDTHNFCEAKHGLSLKHETQKHNRTPIISAKQNTVCP
jgi:putative transposase